MCASHTLGSWQGQQLFFGPMMVRMHFIFFHAGVLVCLVLGIFMHKHHVERGRTLFLSPWCYCHDAFTFPFRLFRLSAVVILTNGLTHHTSHETVAEIINVCGR
jgi:hypothetical protein